MLGNLLKAELVKHFLNYLNVLPSIRLLKVFQIVLNICCDLMTDEPMFLGFLVVGPNLRIEYELNLALTFLQKVYVCVFFFYFVF